VLSLYCLGTTRPGETYRHVVDARRPFKYGGGACTVLVRRVDVTVEVLFQADLRTGRSRPLSKPPSWQTRYARPARRHGDRLVPAVHG
jgi:hypothetical protein